MRRLQYDSWVPFTLTYAVIALGIVALMVVLQQYMYHLSSGVTYGFSWGLVIAKTVMEYLLWLCGIPLIALWLQPFLTGNKVGLSGWLLLIIKSLSLVVIHRLLTIGLFDIGYALWNDRSIALLRAQNRIAWWSGLFSSSIQVAIIAGITWGISYYKRFVRQSQALMEAELKALKMQLRPHFLFNTFHSISALIDINPDAAHLMLSRLSHLLRGVLEKEQDQHISLKEEMAFARHYLGIEEVRFQDRLHVRFSIAPDTLSAKVPPLIMQPLVENALKLGLANMPQGGEIEVGSALTGQRELMLWVADNGPGPVSKQPGFGLGLKNVEKRLRQLFGANFTLEAIPVIPSGFRATLIIPLEYYNAPSYAH